MHVSGSFIHTVLDYARFLLELPGPDGQYTNPYIAQMILPFETANVMNAVNLGAENKILSRIAVSLAAGTEYYTLPPNTGIVRVGKISTDGILTHDWYPEGEFHPLGVGWALEGNQLAFRPIPQTPETWTVWLRPSNEGHPIYGSGTVVGSNRDTVDLPSNPDLGMLDLRENAYAGCILRRLHSGAQWEERIIQSYDANTRRVVVRTPFTATGHPADTAPITVEVAPLAYQTLYQAIACRVAMNVGVARNMDKNKLATIEGLIYRHALKTVRDTVNNIMERRSKHMDRRTYDNVSYIDAGLIP